MPAFINFNGGMLQAAANTSVDSFGPLTINVRNGGGTIDTNGFNLTVTPAMVHSTIAGDNAIDGGLTKIGAGTLTIPTAATYTGDTNVNGGVLQLNAAINGSRGTIRINNGGTLNFGGNDTWGNDATTASAAISVNAGGTLSSGGFFNTLWNLNLNGGTILLDGGVNAQFPALQTAGTLSVTGTQASTVNVGSGSNNVINIGGQGNPTLTINVAEATSDANPDLTINAPLQINQRGAGSNLTKTGPGTLVLNAPSSYTGATTLNAGTLRTTATGTIGSSALVVNAEAGIASSVEFGSDQTVTSLSGSGAGTARVGVAASTTLTVNQATNTSFAGALVNSGTLVKNGGGALEFAAAPTLNSASVLLVNNGTLRFNAIAGSATVASGATAAVVSGATLELAGTVSALSSSTSPANRVNIVNNSTVAGGGLLVSGSGQQVGGISGVGSTLIAAGGSLTANAIIQNALIIGGDAGQAATLTIAASAAAGHPLDDPLASLIVQPQSGGQLLGDSLPSRAGTDRFNFAELGSSAAELLAAPPSNSEAGGNSTSVPEPSSNLLIFVALSGIVGWRTSRRVPWWTR